VIARSLFLLGGVVWLAGCASALRWNPDTYTVRRGDTLYSIAVDFNVDPRDLAAWNSLGDGNYIREGQKLRLTSGGSRSSAVVSEAQPASASAPVRPDVAAPGWVWPAPGRVVLRYGESPKTQSGVRIGGAPGGPVAAAAAGEIVYAGTGLRSYGQLLIVKHNETWLSAYGFNSRLLVGEGQRVQQGQVIAEMGEDSAGVALLHFEIRRNGKPVNPLQYLPRR
jgi:lipoprotein NlpD